MSWHSFKDSYNHEIAILLLSCIIVAAYHLLDMSCPFLALTGIPCPTCNMTSAILSLLRGDVHSYMSLNAMALPVLAVFVCEIFNRAFGRYKKILHICSAAVLVLNLVYYGIRLDFAGVLA